jgi:hypothetical protein
LNIVREAIFDQRRDIDVVSDSVKGGGEMEVDEQTCSASYGTGLKP